MVKFKVITTYFLSKKSLEKSLQFLNFNFLLFSLLILDIPEVALNENEDFLIIPRIENAGCSSGEVSF